MRVTTPRAPLRALATMVLAFAMIAASAAGIGAEVAGGNNDTNAQLRKAEAYIEPFLEYPTGVGIDTPLSQAPEAGTEIVFISCPLPLCQRIKAGLEAGAAVLGWEVTTLTSDVTDPSSDNSNLLQAVAQQPDAIVITGGDVPTYQEGIDAAKEADIPVFLGNAENVTLGDGTGLYSNIFPTIPQRTREGNMLGDLIAVDSKCKDPSLVVINVPEFASAVGKIGTQAQKRLKKRCGDQATTDTLDVPAAQALGGRAVPSAISYLQANPDVNYLMFVNNDIAIGVTPQLEQAGLADQVAVLGGSATTDATTQIAEGNHLAWIGQNFHIEGWRIIDAIARYLNGDNYKRVSKALVEETLITQDNVMNPDEDFDYPADYEAIFRQLWLVEE